METLGSTMSVPDDDRFIKNIRKVFEKNEAYGTVKNLRQEYQAKHQ